MAQFRYVLEASISSIRTRISCYRKSLGYLVWTNDVGRNKLNYMKQYKKLDAIENENIEKVREFAELMNEVFALETRRRYLLGITEENDELRSSIWTTQEGVSKAISDLDDNHLKNIVIHLNNRGASNTRIRKEYQKRFGVAPELPAPVEEFDF